MARFINPVIQPNDKKGRSEPNSQMFFYEAGTLTPKTTFNDVALTAPNSHPVIADGAGRFPDIWLASGTYRTQFKDKNNVLIWDRDDVADETLAGTIIVNLATLQLAIDSTLLEKGGAVSIAERESGKGGGAVWDVVLASSVTPNTFNIVQCVGLPLLALVLRVNGEVDAAQVGAFTSSADIAGAFTNVQSLGAKVVMESGTYKSLSTIDFKECTRSLNGRVTIDFDSLPASSAGATCSNESDIIGFDFDCTNTTSMIAGFQHILEFTPTRTLKLDIKGLNVTNTDNTEPCYGVLLFVGSGASNSSIDVEAVLEGRNITATANAIIGDTGGKATGVLLSVNKAGMENRLTLLDPRASKIYPSEDGDGIHIFDTDSGNLKSKSVYRVVRAKTSDCSKRGVKMQAPNVILSRPFIDIDLNDGLATAAMAVQSLGVNNKILFPYVVGTNTAANSDGSIVGSAENFSLINPISNVTNGQNLIRLETGASNYKVTGASVTTEDSYASSDFSLILIEGGANGTLEIDKVLNTNKTGSAIRYISVTGKNTLEINQKCEAAHLVRYSFCTGEFHIAEAYGSLSDTIFRQDGDSGDYFVRHMDAETTGVTAATCVAPVKWVGNGSLKSLTNGILYTGAVNLTDREISGEWTIEATGGGGVGVDAGSSVDAVLSNIETINFATHIKYNFSTNTLIRNLLPRGAGAPISNTSATEIRDNNFSEATTAQLASLADIVNTNNSKSVGMMVFNTTTFKPVWSKGSADNSVWVDATGATVHTPV
jgi:hypothetical protein